MKLKTILCATVISQILPIAVVQADEILLKNGDKISGEILSKTDQAVLMKTSFAGEISISWDAVSKLTSDTPITVQLDDESMLKGKLISSDDGTIRLSADNLFKTDPIPLNKIAAINPPAIEPIKTKYTGIANVGAYRTTGNTDNQAVHMDAEMVARRETDRLTVGAAYNQAETNGVQSAKNSLFYAKYDLFINDKWYGYGNTLFEKDRFQDLKLRSVVGGGLGYQFWETDISALSLEAGPSYANEDYYTGEDKDFAAARWALNYHHWFYNKSAQFFHNHEGLVPFSDTGDVYIRSRTGIRIPLISKFTITTEIDVDYDAKPSAGNKKTDTRYLFNLGYQWQ